MRIFISYRYDDDKGGVRRLYKTLSKTTVDGERCQVAMGRSDELKLHIRAARRNGATWEEIRAAIKRAGVYSGAPALRSATRHA